MGPKTIAEGLHVMPASHLRGLCPRLVGLALGAGELRLFPNFDLSEALLQHGGAMGGRVGPWKLGDGAASNVRVRNRTRLEVEEVGFVEALKADGRVRLEGLDLGYLAE